MTITGIDIMYNSIKITKDKKCADHSRDLSAVYNTNVGKKDALTFYAGLSLTPTVRAKVTVEKTPNQNPESFDNNNSTNIYEPSL